MKAVLISIHPKFCELIFNGKKTIEVRKTAPKLETPFKVYVYQTKIKFKVKNWQENFQSIVFTPNGGVEEGNGKVIGSFVCDEIYVRPANVIYYGKGQEDYLDLLKSACMTEREVLDYMGGQFNRDTYFWHVTDLKIYDKPRELGEFYTICNKYGDDSCGDCPYLAVEQCSFPCDDCVDTWCSVDNIKPITRPPQSWQYVEELQ